MSRGSGCAIITGAAATATAAGCGGLVTITTTAITIITGTIITGTTIITVGTVTDTGAPLCNDRGAMVGPTAGLSDGSPPILFFDAAPASCRLALE
jgi:hypothetical protein